MSRSVVIAVYSSLCSQARRALTSFGISILKPGLPTFSRDADIPNKGPVQTGLVNTENKQSPYKTGARGRTGTAPFR